MAFLFVHVTWVPGLAPEKRLATFFQVDGVHVYSLFYAKMLALLTPRKLIPQLLLDGRLCMWWGQLPEGLLPKFDLMWFMPLARFAELRWANKVEEALAESQMPGKAEQWPGGMAAKE